MKHAYEHGIKHAGIIYIPNKMSRGEKERFADVAALAVDDGCGGSQLAFLVIHSTPALMESIPSSLVAMMSWHFYGAA